jgi:hypothetical protein
MLQQVKYHAPRCVKNGKLIIHRVDSGKYTHEDLRRNTWLIERIEPETADGWKNPNAGMWTYRHEDAAPDDIYWTKADAVKALQLFAYGDSMDEDYSQ